MSIKKIAVIGLNDEISSIFKDTLPNNINFIYDFFVVSNLNLFNADRYNIILFLNPSRDFNTFYEFASIVRTKTNVPFFLIFNKVDKEQKDKLIKLMPLFLSNFQVEPSELEVKLQLVMELFEKIPDALNVPYSFYHALYKAFNEPLIFCDYNGKILSFNPAADQLFELMEKDLISTPFYNLIVLEDSRETFRQDFNIWLKQPEQVVFECPLISRINHYFPAEVSLTPIHQELADFILVHCRDISERLNTNDELSRLIEEIQYSKDIIEQNANEVINLNAELQESELKLKELNSSKDKFFSIIAHDLKNPFQNLLGLTNIMANDFQKLTPDEISDFMHGLNESAHNLFKLLENLLSWARMQQGAMDYKPDYIYLDEIAASALKLIEPQAADKSINLELYVQPGLKVYCDVNMISAVIRNLLSNAVKFTRDGGAIKVQAEKLNDYYAKVEVFDSGVGMSEETINKLFRIDEHHTSPGTRDEQGTGLGLILCKELVEKNNGKIFVSSIVNQGTIFKFTLPLKQFENK